MIRLNRYSIILCCAFTLFVQKVSGVRNTGVPTVTDHIKIGPDSKKDIVTDWSVPVEHPHLDDIYYSITEENFRH